MSDLVEFLLARVAVDEAEARKATAGPWRVDSDEYPEAIEAGEREPVISGSRWGGEASVFSDGADAVHIARHDPARVLAQCEAVRRVVEIHGPDDYWVECIEEGMAPEDVGRGPVCNECGSQDAGTERDHPCPTLRALAQPYADHPDFRAEWKL